jgi:hypothetical protein
MPSGVRVTCHVPMSRWSLAKSARFRAIMCSTRAGPAELAVRRRIWSMKRWLLRTSAKMTGVPGGIRDLQCGVDLLLKMLGLNGFKQWGREVQERFGDLSVGSLFSRALGHLVLAARNYGTHAGPGFCGITPLPPPQSRGQGKERSPLAFRAAARPLRAFEQEIDPAFDIRMPVLIEVQLGNVP